MTIISSLVGVEASAQSNRAGMVDSARLMIDNFNERQSLGLLRRALNPALGAPDRAWTNAVQLLAQTLLQTNQKDEADAWLRWALRLSPNLQVDSVTYIPSLVRAFHDARAYVTAARTDPRVSVQFQWVTAPPAGGFGDLQVSRGTAGNSPAVQLTVNGEFLDEGRARRFAPGSYRVSARSTGQSDADITTEVLPGVTTVVTMNFAPVASVLSSGAEQRVKAALVRLDLSQAAGTCRVGAVVGNSGLVIASYSALRDTGAVTLQLANARVASEQVRVAAYNTGSNLSVLSANAGGDSLAVSTTVRDGDDLWAAYFPNCGNASTLSKVTVASVAGDSVVLQENAPALDQRSVLVNSAGAVTAFMTGPRSARLLTSAEPLLVSARANRASGALMTVSEVVRREVGSTAVAPPAAAPPVIPPSQPVRIGKRSKKLPIIGAVVAGGVAAAFLASKSGGGSKPTTGGIVIRLP